MRLRITKLDEFQFLTSVQNQVWGSKVARFTNWEVGDFLIFIVDKAISGIAEVAGKPYVSKQRLWDNGLFPHRIPIKFVHVMLAKNRPPVLGEIRDVLTATWGPKYGFGIINQQIISDTAAETLMKLIQSRPNDLEMIQSGIANYLAEEKAKRDIKVKLQEKQKVKKPQKEKIEEEEVVITKEEALAHSKAQSQLIRLGKISGCAVWVASNDRNRQYSGKSLGDECLKELPNFGLSKEANDRISRIDILWIRQNAPVCAFEVETKTPVYSGLLRMSDLLAVVPALKINLFIVAPQQRQEKVMSELGRPTFERIGLSDFCRYISTEKLDSLLSKVSDLEGHIQPSILDTIAIELEDEVGSALE